VAPQTKSNPNNTANSKFNVAQQSLFRILGEYNEYLQQLNSQYGSRNLIPAANKPAVNNRIENYQRRIREANRIFGLYSPY
jgi:flagellar biosynthesis chaperone FliJ